MQKQIKTFLWEACLSAFAINSFGIIRTILGLVVEREMGLSFVQIGVARVSSGGLDIFLSCFFGLAREGLYRLRIVDRAKRQQRLVVDTLFFSTYKTLSYTVCLLFLDLEPIQYWVVLGSNAFFMLVTGALNCWYLDLLREANKRRHHKAKHHHPSKTKKPDGPKI